MPRANSRTTTVPLLPSRRSLENCTRLSLLDSVNAQTFCYFDSYIISDPTAFEEDVVKDSIHIVVGKDDKVCPSAASPTLDPVRLQER